MKILAILLVVFFFGGLALIFANNQSVQLNVGDIAPDFSLKDQDGKVRKLSDYTGERLIVYFFPKADTPG
jgi:peroxiredoxin Q/BCP